MTTLPAPNDPCVNDCMESLLEQVASHLSGLKEAAGWPDQTPERMLSAAKGELRDLCAYFCRVRGSGPAAKEVEELGDDWVQFALMRDRPPPTGAGRSSNAEQTARSIFWGKALYARLLEERREPEASGERILDLGRSDPELAPETSPGLVVKRPGEAEEDDPDRAVSISTVHERDERAYSAWPHAAIDTVCYAARQLWKDGPPTYWQYTYRKRTVGDQAGQQTFVRYMRGLRSLVSIKADELMEATAALVDEQQLALFAALLGRLLARRDGHEYASDDVASTIEEKAAQLERAARARMSRRYRPQLEQFEERSRTISEARERAKGDLEAALRSVLAELSATRLGLEESPAEAKRRHEADRRARDNLGNKLGEVSCERFHGLAQQHGDGAGLLSDFREALKSQTDNSEIRRLVRTCVILVRACCLDGGGFNVRKWTDVGEAVTGRRRGPGRPQAQHGEEAGLGGFLQRSLGLARALALTVAAIDVSLNGYSAPDSPAG